MEQDIDMMAPSTTPEGTKPFFTDGLWIGKIKPALYTAACFCLHSNTQGSFLTMETTETLI